MLFSDDFNCVMKALASEFRLVFVSVIFIQDSVLYLNSRLHHFQMFMMWKIKNC